MALHDRCRTVVFFGEILSRKGSGFPYICYNLKNGIRMKMKSAIFVLTTLMLLNGCGLRTSGQKKSGSESQKERSMVNVPLADPFILLHDGTYYAYGTKAENGIAVFESDDLQTWRKASGRPPKAWPCIRTTYTETAGSGLRRFIV